MFIGREDQIRWLTNKVFTKNPEKGYSCSLRGPNGIGKTYLKNHVLNQFMEELRTSETKNVFVIDLIMQRSSYYLFFLDIFKEAADFLTEEVLEQAPVKNEQCLNKLRRYLRTIRDIEELNAQSESRLSELIRNFFDATSVLGFYFILLIDEFDNTLSLFPQESDDGLLFRTLFALSAKAGKYKLLSIMLISRRRIGTIAHHMESGSNIDDAYPSLHLVIRGFNNAELEAYYQSFASLPCGVPGEALRSEIEFYMGRHPGMLMELREHISLFCQRPEDLDMKAYYHEEGSGIRSTFSRMMTLMKTEYTDRARRIPAMSAFKQVFNIDPAYDANLSDQAQLLYDFGFVSNEISAVSDDLEELRPEASKCLNIIGESWYAPLSRRFLLYIAENITVSEENEISSLINSTERIFRNSLQKQLKQLYGDDWQEHIDPSAFKKTDYWENLKKDANTYGALSRGVEVSVLDILSFYNLSMIVNRNWDKLKNNFPSYARAIELCNECYSLTKYRNCCMHGTLRILGTEQHNEMKSICRKLKADSERFLEGKVDTAPSTAVSATLPSAPPVASGEYGVLQPLELQARNERYSNKKCDFLCETKKPRGNLIGKLVNSNLPASIAAKDAVLIRDEDPVGKKYRVRVIKWDNGPMAQMFNVIPL